MRTTIAITCLTLFTIAGIAVTEEKTRPEVFETAITVLPDEAKWMPCSEGPEGCEVAVLTGDMKNGSSRILYRAPAGSAPFRMFWHSSPEHVVMIQGRLTGVASDGEEFSMEPGTYWYIPAGMIHGGVRCSEEGPCIWYEYFEAPWDSNVVEGG